MHILYIYYIWKDLALIQPKTVSKYMILMRQSYTYILDTGNMVDIKVDFVSDSYVGTGLPGLNQY